MKAFYKIALLTLAVLQLSACGMHRARRHILTHMFTEEDKRTLAESKKMLDAADEFCRKASAGFYGLPIPITVGGTIGGASGERPVNDVYGGLTISAVRDGVGNVFVIGSGPGAQVELLANWEGNVFLCGAGVKAIKGLVRGNVFVVHGDVGTVEGLAGNLFIRGGYLKGRITHSEGWRLVENPDGRMWLGVGNEMMIVNE